MKRNEVSAYEGLKDSDDKECEDMRMTRLRRRVLRRARSRGGASNKYTLRKVLQLGFRKLCFLKDSRVRNAYVFWQAFCGAAVSQICIICFRRNT